MTKWQISLQIRNHYFQVVEKALGQNSFLDIGSLGCSSLLARDWSLCNITLLAPANIEM